MSILPGDEEPAGPRTALVLSAGGMRGLAHVGVWRALVEAGVRVDHVVGSSIGALVGAAVASGMEVGELEERAHRVGRKDVAVPRRWPWWARNAEDPGLLRGDVLRSFVTSLLPERPRERLAIPLDVSTVDLDTGRVRWFSFRPGSSQSNQDWAGAGGSGADLVDAVLASMAIPVFYPPVDVGGATCMDGGVLAPVPVTRAADTGADRIVAVDVSTDLEPRARSAARQRGLLGVSMRALTIATATRNGGSPDPPSPTVLHRIRPELEDVGAFTFGRNEELVEQGYRAARSLLGEIAGEEEPAPVLPDAPAR